MCHEIFPRQRAHNMGSENIEAYVYDGKCRYLGIKAIGVHYCDKDKSIQFHSEQNATMNLTESYVLHAPITGTDYNLHREGDLIRARCEGNDQDLDFFIPIHDRYGCDTIREDVSVKAGIHMSPIVRSEYDGKYIVYPYNKWTFFAEVICGDILFFDGSDISALQISFPGVDHIKFFYESFYEDVKKNIKGEAFPDGDYWKWYDRYHSGVFNNLHPESFNLID